MTSIRFVDYKEQSLDDLETSSSESKLEENRRIAYVNLWKNRYR